MQTDLPESFLNTLEQFEHNAGVIVDNYCADIPSQEAPEYICHYTDDAGLCGILKSGQLWLTDILKLNDPSEIKFGIEHAVTELNQAATNADRVAVDFSKRFSSVLQNILPKVARFYSLSFSMAEDDLCQWRAYADDGKGYVLVFDGREMEHAFTSRHGLKIAGASTFPVAYNECCFEEGGNCDHACQLANLYNTVAIPAIELLSNSRLATLNTDLHPRFMERLSVALASTFFQISTLFKHSAYFNEREYRFLQMSGAGCDVSINVRRRSNQIVEYATFDWRRFAPHALRKVIIGPAADKSKAQRFVEDCVRLYCGNSVVIEHSIIPYSSIH